MRSRIKPILRNPTKLKACLPQPVGIAALARAKCCLYRLASKGADFLTWLIRVTRNHWRASDGRTRLHRQVGRLPQRINNVNFYFISFNLSSGRSKDICVRSESSFTANFWKPMPVASSICSAEFPELMISHGQKLSESNAAPSLLLFWLECPRQCDTRRHSW